MSNTNEKLTLCPILLSALYRKTGAINRELATVEDACQCNSNCTWYRKPEDENDDRPNCRVIFYMSAIAGALTITAKELDALKNLTELENLSVVSSNF